MKQRTKVILAYIINIVFSIFYYAIFAYIYDKVPWLKKIFRFLVDLFPNQDIGEGILKGIWIGLLIGILRVIDDKIL
jgi:hypothetical protein